MKKTKGTQSSNFGVSARKSHNSEAFYNSKLYNNRKISHGDLLSKEENIIPDIFLNKIFNKSSEFMDEIPDNSVHLMVTSPPYNVGKTYDEDLSLEDYCSLLQRVFEETFRVLVYGGRACINIANVGRKPYIPLHSYIIKIMQELNFLMRGEIIWNKSASAGSSTAWGSWNSAKNPTLRDVHEYILIFCKGSFSRENKGESTMEKQDFMKYTKSIWDFPTVRAKKIGHPAPFPVELPHRLINFYTYKNEVILDPFIGSGQTAIAAINNKRNFIGYDNDKDFCNLAEERIRANNKKLKAAKEPKQLNFFTP